MSLIPPGLASVSVRRQLLSDLELVVRCPVNLSSRKLCEELFAPFSCHLRRKLSGAAKSGIQMEVRLFLQLHVFSSQAGHVCPAGTQGIVRT